MENNDPTPSDEQPKKKKHVRWTPTKAERREMLDYAKFLVSRRLYKSDQKRMFRRRFMKEGRILDARTIEGYFARARQLLVKESGKSKEEFRIDAISFWDSMVAGPGNLKPGERMYAQERLDKITGVVAPTETRIKDESDDRPTTLSVQLEIIEPGEKPDGPGGEK